MHKSALYLLTNNFLISFKLIKKSWGENIYLSFYMKDELKNNRIKDKVI